jgi:RimJ/RimL family protein N-acetyltransferase
MTSLETGPLLLRPCRDEDLTTEGGRAALAYAFETVDANHVISLIRPDNAALIRVPQKLDERPERRIERFAEDTLV